MSEVDFRIADLDHLESPWGNAGGVVKKLEDVEMMARTGVGWVEAGSYTIEPRQGNRALAETSLTADQIIEDSVVDYFYDQATGETFNSLGMPNQGLDELIKQIPEMIKIVEAYGKKLVVNVAPVTTEPIAESVELVDRVLDAGAHKVLLNGGCPNVEDKAGGAHIPLSLHPQTFGKVLLAMIPVVQKHNKKIGVRISPPSNYDQSKTTLRRIETARTVDCIWLPNTWPVGNASSPLRRVPGGGCSGPAWAPQARKELEWGAGILWGSSIDLISSSSIMTGRELAIRLKMGAVAGAGTTFYYESINNWADDTDKFLREFADSA